VSIFAPQWVPWTGLGHLLFWVVLAAVVEIVTHNIMRAYRART
jgi:hypothetical protein